LGGETDERYQKLEPIGTGPLGAVYKGRQIALGFDVAIKELKDIFDYFSFLQKGEVLDRFKNEIHAQAQIRHPGIIPIFDQTGDAAKPFVVMQLMRSSLKEKLLASGGKGLPPPV